MIGEIFPCIGGSMIEINYFEGVELYDIDKYDLPKYYGMYFMGRKLKFVYIDLFNQYAFFWSNGLYMNLHDYLCELAIKKLKFSYKYNRGFSKPTPDIEFLDRQIEVETGLKHGYDGLKKRLYRNPFFVYVVVPNLQVKKRYKNYLKQFHGRVYSLREFYNLKEL